jgi:phage tail-like protein
MSLPLVQPTRKTTFLVTMWDTPASNFGGPLGVIASVESALLSLGMNILAGGFAKVEGLEAVNTLENYKQGGDNITDLQFFARATYPKIVLKRGVTFNTDIWDWHHQVVAGKVKGRKSGTIILMDHRKLFDLGADVSIPFQFVPVGAWIFYNALPEKLAGPALDAMAGEDDLLAIETLELRPERIERLSLALIPGAADLGALASGLIGMAGAAAIGGAGALAFAAAGV